MTQTQEFTREDLKVNALLERIAHLENEKADLRVELTLYSQECVRLQDRVKELEDDVSETTEGSDSDAAN